MADYYPLIARAVEGLDDRGPTMRNAVYEPGPLGAGRAAEVPRAAPVAGGHRPRVPRPRRGDRRVEADHNPVLGRKPPHAAAPASRRAPRRPRLRRALRSAARRPGRDASAARGRRGRGPRAFLAEPAPPYEEPAGPATAGRQPLAGRPFAGPRPGRHSRVDPGPGDRRHRDRGLVPARYARRRSPSRRRLPLPPRRRPRKVPRSPSVSAAGRPCLSRRPRRSRPSRAARARRRAAGRRRRSARGAVRRGCREPAAAKAYPGRVVWRLEGVNAGQGQPSRRRCAPSSRSPMPAWC